MSTVVDLHRDNFIQLLHNPEFQRNEIDKKEQSVRYVTELFKAEIEARIEHLSKGPDD